MTGPLDVTCPRCGAAPRHDCRTPSGLTPPRTHAARWATADQASTRCPSCQQEVRVKADGTSARHSRPALIPGGIARSTCTGSGTPTEPTPVPDWIRAAFTEGAPR